jgi:hypothetical protein
MPSMKKILLIVFLFCFSFVVYAENQGAQQYDWNNCMQAKSSACINDCSNSEDIDCGDNCNSIAKDKCISLGLNPPQ